MGKNTMSSTLRNNLLILFVTGLLFWISLGSLLGTLPLYVRDVGGTPQEVGIVVGAFSIGLLLSRRSMGLLADNRSRKIVLLIGCGVVAIAPLGYLIGASIPVLAAVRAFHGISNAAFTTAYLALVADISPRENRTSYISYMLLVTPIGLSIGPAVGGILSESFGYSTLFLFTFSLGVLSLLCGLLIPGASVSKTEDDRKSQPESDFFWSNLKSPRVRIPTLVMLLAGMLIAIRVIFIPLFIKDLNVELNPGWFYTVNSIASLSIRLAIGPLTLRFGRGLLISISMLLYVLGMLALCIFVSNGTDFLIVGIVTGLGFGMIIPLMSATIADRCHQNERGRVFSLCLGGLDLGIAIAGPAFGFIADTWDYRTVFALATAISFINLLIYVTKCNDSLVSSIRYALGKGEDTYARN